MQTQKQAAALQQQHTVRFNDEEEKLLRGFEQQKAEMKRILEQAKLEHQRQMAEIEGAMAKVVKSDDVSSVNSSFAASSTAKLNSANGTFNAKLDKVADDLDQVKLYQQRLLQRYRADMSNVASITAADESSNVIVKELETSSASSSFKTEPKSSKPLTLPRYSPVVLDSMNTTRDAEPLQSEATATVTHESLIRMEIAGARLTHHCKANGFDTRFVAWTWLVP